MDYGLGDKSSLGKFYELGSHVLLIGVDYDINISFYLSEMKSGVRQTCASGLPILINGKKV
ncbi:MAG: AAC(3) family N-acetyltransferase [Halanaerobiales bacterium]|nr:AAC(3) family N-acetyltransferase [Halanaerobiales bacterium]